MSITLYGIHNCDTCRKARRWLDEQDIDYRWHDLRKDGLDTVMVEGWLKALGPDTLLNRRGPSWRKLPTAEQAAANDGSAAIFVANPTIIKRPVLDHHGDVTVAFRADSWAKRLGL